MKAIGAGFPRTGTLSTKAALEHLGFGPCHHFVTQVERPQDAEVWLAAARGHPVDWTALFADFGCAVDWPQMHSAAPLWLKARPRCCSTCAGGWPRRLRGAPWT